ncbi:hypothetical protein M404DRAFT_1004297 [Pisolithus tinctorius Marx 270]|uniref:Uncharacterized protein n=1 Tax=Pisolithus tinctorius Marx 270 TaxID=870435 RepID=A0A0C3JR66_PISTI|nr:hypothetical protein M404DRAFT_1004297 [Pisolithus tinctorius Marx 270]
MQHGSKYCNPLTKRSAKRPPRLVQSVINSDFQGCGTALSQQYSARSPYDVRRLLQKPSL